MCNCYQITESQLLLKLSKTLEYSEFKNTLVIKLKFLRPVLIMLHNILTKFERIKPRIKPRPLKDTWHEMTLSQSYSLILQFLTDQKNELKKTTMIKELPYILLGS